MLSSCAVQCSAEKSENFQTEGQKEERWIEAGCNAGQANYNTTDNNHKAKRDSPSFCAPWQLEEDLLPTVYNCATLAATMTGSESKKLMTIGQMISKQAIGVLNYCFFPQFPHPNFNFCKRQFSSSSSSSSSSFYLFAHSLYGWILISIKQFAVKNWNQMPRRWDEKSLTGRNVDDLVSSYLVVWSHLALPCAHGMKNEQKR
ncbi:hypothetical protein T06_3390 [Trichinella sp. T6]|nr:hypothetical protein T06_3390 [Trichinella sp. T6]